jgi:hypothetical protein
MKQLSIEEKKIRYIKTNKFYEFMNYNWGEDDDEFQKK